MVGALRIRCLVFEWCRGGRNLRARGVVRRGFLGRERSRRRRVGRLDRRRGRFSLAPPETQFGALHDAGDAIRAGRDEGIHHAFVEIERDRGHDRLVVHRRRDVWLPLGARSLAPLPFKDARLSPRVAHRARRVGGPRRDALGEARDEARERDERERGATDEDEPQARKADQEGARRREQRPGELSEQLADETARGVGPERRTPRAPDLDERRRDHAE
jgi:hypothetical protein